MKITQLILAQEFRFVRNVCFPAIEKERERNFAKKLG
jgi:hypothetical protein